MHHPMYITCPASDPKPRIKVSSGLTFHQYAVVPPRLSSAVVCCAGELTSMLCLDPVDPQQSVPILQVHSRELSHLHTARTRESMDQGL